MNDFRFPTEKKRLTQWERVKILALLVAAAAVLGWVGSGSFAAYDGSGTYNRTQDYTADRDAGPPTNVISADKFDDDLDGIATALSLNIVGDGQQTTTAVIPFAFGISSDTIVEESAAAGVTIDSVLLKDGGITLGGALDEILGGDTDGTMILSADTASGQGGNITLFGNTHATLASDILFRDDTTSTLLYDKSATLWDFQANDLITTGAVSVDTINEASGASGVTIDSVLLKDNIVTATTGTFTNVGGTLSTAAQTNITSLGTLTGLTVNGTATATTLGGTLSTVAQPNITSVGILTSLDVSGTITVDTIDETTSTVGVTIDGVLMKDDGSLAVQTAGEVAGYKVTRDYATNSAMVQAVQSGTPGGSAGNVAGYLANIVQPSQRVWSGQLDGVETSSIDGDGDMILAGPLSIDNTTASTSATTGSLHTDGGLGVAKEAYIGDAVIVGSPTGGDKGVGTINAQGIFVNGSAVGTGTGDMVGTNNLSDVSSASTSRANLGINNWTKHSTVHTSESAAYARSCGWPSDGESEGRPGRLPMPICAGSPRAGARGGHAARGRVRREVSKGRCDPGEGRLLKPPGPHPVLRSRRGHVVDEPSCLLRGLRRRVRLGKGWRAT